MKSLTKVFCLVFLLVVSINNQVEASTFSAATIFSEVNQARLEAGLGAYNESLALTLASLRKGFDMYTAGYLSHVSPTGLYPWDFVTGVGYKYQTVGENLGFAYTDEVALVSAMLDSPAHRDNILSTSHTELGVGLVPHPTMIGKSIVVMIFASQLP